MAGVKKTIALVGAGHANIQLIKGFKMTNARRHFRMVVVDPVDHPSYSGMVPGSVAGFYEPEETRIQLRNLVEWAGVEYFQCPVDDVDLEKSELVLGGDDKFVPFDVASFDIGSCTRGLDTLPGVKEYSIPTRPIHLLVSRIKEKEEEFEREQAKDVSVVVVGGGVAGIELALNIWGRLHKKFNLQISLLDNSKTFLIEASPSFRKTVLHHLQQRNIQLFSGVDVTRLTETEVVSRDGRTFSFSPPGFVLWATGAAPHPLHATLAKKGVAISDRGWLSVNSYLQSVSHPMLFAAGDCCDMQVEGVKSPPKAGVYAVRAGPPLFKNLMCYLNGEPLKTFHPQGDFLRLIGCGDKTAIGSRWGLALSGRWVWELKDHIDKMFMSNFQIETLLSLSDGENSSEGESSSGEREFFEREGKRKRGKKELRNFDDLENIEVTSDPEEAWKILKDSERVEFEEGWGILRKMMKDSSFCDAILSLSHFD